MTRSSFTACKASPIREHPPKAAQASSLSRTGQWARNNQIRPRIEAARVALAANGYTTTPTALTNWSVGRREYVRTQLATVQPAFAFLTPNNTTTSQTTIQLTGQAPIEVRDVWLNGNRVDVEWTSATAWRFTVSLPVIGNNPFTADGYNRNGNATHQATVNIIRDP